MKHVKKALSYSIAGSLGLTVIASLSGCEQPTANDLSGINQVAADQNYFMVIEQTGDAPATYRIAEQHPTTGPSRAVLRDMNGIERFLSEEELKAIAEEEAKRVEAGTSRLAQDGAQMSSGGLSLGETLLAAAAGSLIGGMLANSLMNNRNFQQNSQRYNSSRPNAPTSLRSGSTTQAKSGFFGNRSTGATSSTRTSTFGSKSGSNSFRSFGG
jgi:hypothetical protein